MIKARLLRRWVALAALPLLSLNSCITVAVTGVDRQTYTQFGTNGGGQRLTPTSYGPNSSRKELLAALGEPKRKRTTQDGGETWTWPRRSIWCGAYAMVTLIPIPLCLPLGQEATEVRFGPGDGPALEWTEQRYADAYTGIGISPNIEVGDPGFGPFFWRSTFGRRDVSVGSAPEPDRKKVHHRLSGGSI